jgi:hypothetical protein
MSSEIKTFLINDNRISGISSEIMMPIKRGPSSSVIQSYKQVSNSSSSCLFNVSVPSENTLVNRNLRINAKLQMTVTFNNAFGATQTPFYVLPSSFPLNTGLASASVTINNTKLSVQTQDVLAVILKQYQQEFLARNVQTSPSYVDKYWGSLSDAGADEIPSSYFSGVKYAEKDSNVSARADSNISFILYKANGDLATSQTGFIVGDGAGCYADITISVSEPILGLPTFEMKDHEAAFMGVNNLELTLQLNDCNHVLYFPANLEALISSRSAGLKKSNVSTFLNDDARLTVNYLTLHPSDYAKMMPKNVIPYNEFVNYKTTQSITLTAESSSTAIISNQVQLRQVPDKIYINVTPTYSNLPTTASNHLSFPISNLSITFNNRANLLSEMDSYDLYTMSRRNGCHQSYQEFRGTIRDFNGTEYLSLGSIIVIDPRDLSLDDYLSSGSIGQFSLQAQATCTNLQSNTVFGIKTVIPCQMNIICSYAGVLVTQQGSSASMSGLLTKNLVLETKEAGNAMGDYEAAEEVSGGNIGRSLTSLGNVLNTKGRKMIKNKIDNVKDRIDGSGGGYAMSAGSYQISGSGKSRLSKYM